MDSKIARIVLSEALGDLSFAKFVDGRRKNISNSRVPTPPIPK